MTHTQKNKKPRNRQQNTKLQNNTHFYTTNPNKPLPRTTRTLLERLPYAYYRLHRLHKSHAAHNTTRVLAALIQRTELITLKCVQQVRGDRADDVSVKQIARDAGLPYGTVQNALGRLYHMGWITHHRQWCKGTEYCTSERKLSTLFLKTMGVLDAVKAASKKLLKSGKKALKAQFQKYYHRPRSAPVKSLVPTPIDAEDTNAQAQRAAMAAIASSLFKSP